MFRLLPPSEMIDTAITLPLSKSESARTLIMDALGGHPLTDAVAECDDTSALRAALTSADTDLNIGASGTAMRYLVAYFAATPGRSVRLDGSERMRQRPLAPLVDALRVLGADIEYAGEQGHAPVLINGRRLQGGTVTVDATVSSQFISALMMIAPTMAGGLTVKFDGIPVSTAYLRMTALMMEARGIDVDITPDGVVVKAGVYTPAPADAVSGDWTAASYWYTVSALSSGWIALPGLALPSVQGDSVMTEIGERLGVVTGTADPDDYPDLADGTLQLMPSPEVFSRLDIDATDCPDLVQTLVVAAIMLGMPFHIAGVSTLHDKETDRVQALINECLKFGCMLEEERGALVWDGRRMPITALPVVDTYDDHRMAMAFAPAAIFIPGLTVRDPGVVTKSYPRFWDDLAKAGFVIQDIPDDADPATYGMESGSGSESGEGIESGEGSEA